MPTVESVTSVPDKAPEVKEVQAELPKENTSAPAMQFDFSQLEKNMNVDFGNLNLGEW